MNHCKKIDKGRMATMRSAKEYDDHLRRIDEILSITEPNSAGAITQATWAPIQRAANDSWVDVYNDNLVMGIDWVSGHPTSGTLDTCAIYIVPWKGLGSFTCDVDI